MKSPLGGQLERAERLSTSSDGKRIPKLPAHYQGMRARETRCFTPEQQGALEEQLEREGRRENALLRLTEMEREVLTLQGKLYRRLEVRCSIGAGDLVEYQRRGYVLIPGSEHGGVLEVYGHELVQVEALDLAGVAERLSLTARQVRRLVQSGQRKLRRP